MPVSSVSRAVYHERLIGYRFPLAITQRLSIERFRF